MVNFFHVKPWYVYFLFKKLSDSSLPPTFLKPADEFKFLDILQGKRKMQILDFDYSSRTFKFLPKGGAQKNFYTPFFHTLSRNL